MKLISKVEDYNNKVNVQISIKQLMLFKILLSQSSTAEESDKIKNSANCKSITKEQKELLLRYVGSTEYYSNYNNLQIILEDLCNTINQS